ncbi:MAG: stage 0 sporulation family protein [Eubacteriales bacterium]|nr:stage 0 sporulation family protein [Eubacteriales bacterium]
MLSEVQINTGTKIRMVAVRLYGRGIKRYFYAGDLDLPDGSDLLVEYEGEPIFGRSENLPFFLEPEQIREDAGPVLRLATAEDLQQHQENIEYEVNAFRIAKAKIREHELEMNLVDVELLWSHSRLIFYFTADGRVDFRSLVKDLAAIFRMRIDLRQIGVRDEAKMLGALGICGRELCCSSFLRTFEPVSIKMAKMQNLSMNPGKISGACGRLLCCLKYEEEVYVDLKKRLPKQGETVYTPVGEALVVNVEKLKELVWVEPRGVGDDEVIKYPLAEIKRID